jgi:hypothetical protein
MISKYFLTGLKPVFIIEISGFHLEIWLPPDKDLAAPIMTNFPSHSTPYNHYSYGLMNRTKVLTNVESVCCRLLVTHVTAGIILSL